MLRIHTVILLVLPLLVSCAGYKNPLCTPEFRKDVPNLEGRFSLRFLNDSDFKLLKQEYTISRVGHGTYFLEDKEGVEFHSCEVDGVPFLEAKIFNLKEDGVEGYSSIKLQRQNDGSFDLVPMGVDSDVLKSRNIPYTIIEPKKPDPQKMEKNKFGSEKPTAINITKKIFVDNTKLAREDFLQILDTMSMKVTITPEAPNNLGPVKPH